MPTPRHDMPAAGSTAWISCACLWMLAAGPAVAVEHHVGPGRPFAEIQDVPWESLAAGDVVVIDARPEPYRAKWVICARGTVDRPILIRGVPDPAGRLPLIDGDGATTRRAIDFWGEERGVVKIGGANRPADLMPSHIVIESLEITGARPPHGFTGRRGPLGYASNAAAVFVEKGEDITIRGCVLRGCGNGLFVSPQSRRITIEGCHIHGNGIEGSILEHNAYTASRSIDYRFNRFGPLRAGCRGNNLKDRSAETLVRANWIEGGNRALDLVDGDWSTGPDAPPPQRTVVLGNVLVKLDEEANSQVIHYGGDSGRLEHYRTAPLWFVHNTVVSLRPGSTTLVRLSSPTQRADCRGNIVFTTAPGRSLAIFGGEGEVTLRDNWLMSGWRETLSAGTGRVVVAARGPEGDEPGFVGRAAADYRLLPGSPCAGIAGPLPNEAFPDGLPAMNRPAADAARVPLDATGRFADLGARMTRQPGVNLQGNLRPSPVRSLATGPLVIHGETTAADDAGILVRVTTSVGHQHESRTTASGGRFACRYPADFPGAQPTPPLLLYVDATTAASFGGDDLVDRQAEILLVLVGDDPAEPPDLPCAFTDDFLDSAGRRDRDAVSWSRHRTLVNLFMRGRAAALSGISRATFDLDTEADARWFRSHASLYDFDHRDRDWSTPLGHRVSRGFWQAMWNTWFNRTNDHPWDGNPANTARENYRPYTFANDAADLLVLHAMTARAKPVVDDNRVHLRHEVLANLLAMQHRTPDNFCLQEASGKRLRYTEGAFRYGMFETGEFLTEGTGWFANPRFRDFDFGGVFNGRCLWALGTSLALDPHGPHAEAIRAAIPRTLKFCLHDALELGWARRMQGGGVLWGPPGEHGYLVTGMLAAARTEPGLPLPVGADGGARPLRDVCIDSLGALVDATQSDGTWSKYANVDAVNISALAEGVARFPDHPERDRWRAAAVRSADVWLALGPRAAERSSPTPLFGIRRDGGMTYYLGDEGLPHFALYLNGHWIEALAKLFVVTGDARYRDRARRIFAYYCGDNPLHVRLLSEIGSVNNRVTDRDEDGVEDHLAWDAYPEATAFVQIGLLHLLEAEAP